MKKTRRRNGPVTGYALANLYGRSTPVILADPLERSNAEHLRALDQLDIRPINQRGEVL